MTALAGLWHFDGRPDAAQNCARMLAAQEVYGRHDGAQWSDGDVALGRRLMRVLPEDDFDRQPLIGGGGRYVLVADTRLDNREDLAAALGISPQQARTLCDASILLAALERWGESCLDHLVGDYAFAFWDGTRRRLLLARDPLGQRPLHYHRSKRLFAFASMPKGLHALSEVPYAPNEERIAECLALMPETGSQSFFHGVERVQPGHVVLITSDGLSSRRHWQPSASRLQLRRPEDYSEKLRALLDQAVKCRLRGTGDVGVYLSGGLDSGAVAATAARLLANSDRRIVALTGVPREGYDGPVPRNRIINEGPLAAATAALYPNIDHVVVPNQGGSPLSNLDRSFFLYDRPLNGLERCSVVQQFQLCRTKEEAEGHVRWRSRKYGAELSWARAPARAACPADDGCIWCERRVPWSNRGECDGVASWPTPSAPGARKTCGVGSTEK